MTRSRPLMVLLALFAAGACAVPHANPVARVAPTEVRESTDIGLDAGGDAGSETSSPYVHHGLMTPYGEWRESRETPTNADDLCEVANSNITRAGDAVLNAPAGSGASLARKSWDHQTKPQSFDLVNGRFQLTGPERARLNAQGFVVPRRIAEGTYARALHEIYQSQLPVYVSMDAIFHAIFKSHDTLLADVEEQELTPRLDRTLRAMHEGLGTAAAEYPPDSAKDVDLYLTVARSLLADAAVPSRLGNDAEAATLVQRAKNANEMATVTLFGRARVVDFSQYEPRGHYKSREGMAPYFRASMWLSRLELNLVSRSSRSSAPGFTPDPTETPREAMSALALADLSARSKAAPDVALLDQAWGAFAGRREDVSLDQLNQLRAKAKITSLIAPDVFEKLRSAIGQDFQRTARIHYMPQGSTILPAITTMLGPRVVPDTAATRPLVHSEVAQRFDLHVADLAYVLGDDHAKKYLAADLNSFPTLATQLDAARVVLKSAPRSPDLYTAWLDAIRALSEKPRGELPSFMSTDAFADMRTGSIVAAYGQLRHNHVLLAAQSYDEGGCEIPDGFVEPAPQVLDALIAYADRGVSLMAALGGGAEDKTKVRAYYTRTAKILRVLRAIVGEELANRPLSVEAKRFLAAVIEIVPASSDSPPLHTGWYFQLFRGAGDALESAGFMADYHTSTNTGLVAYAGAIDPDMGIFVVDTSGPPRMFVGPVAHAFETHAPLAKRLADDEIPRAKDRSEPWSRGYVIDAAAEPPITLRQTQAPGDSEDLLLLVKSSRGLGSVTIELLDHHHHQPWARGTVVVGPRVTKVTLQKIPGREQEYGPALRIRVGDQTLWKSSFSLWGGTTFGGMPEIPQD